MWSTASILDARGLKIYANDRGAYMASSRPVDDFKRDATPYSFKKAKLFLADDGGVYPGKPGNIEVFVFEKNDVDEYQNSLESALARMFGSF